MGEDCSDLSQVYPKACTAYYVIHSLKNGTLKEIQINSDFKLNHILELHLIKKEGENITTLTGSNATVGIALLKFNNPQEAHSFMNNMDELIKVVVE